MPLQETQTTGYTSQDARWTKKCVFREGDSMNNPTRACGIIFPSFLGVVVPNPETRQPDFMSMPLKQDLEVSTLTIEEALSIPVQTQYIAYYYVEFDNPLY